ncbi:MAG: ATP-binding cassette domain-containing protein [Deltaproteobacteria bacterium]|nr:ATP-binding cassette domain-containing protein [Deltaproteobacteria bacterium]
MPWPLEIRGLKAQYGDKVILEDLDLLVEKGEILTVLGGSGCGKSTLLKHAVGLMEPAAGTVKLLGLDLLQADEGEKKEVLTRTGVLFQGGALLNSLTIAENVALPLEQHTDLPGAVISDVVRMKLSMVGLFDAAGLFPPELSGGMRKRAALARAIALDPEILFCDEPSAGLDPLTAAGIDRLIRDLRDTLAMTVVAVTHEMASVKLIADRVLMLDEGNVLFEGSLAEMRESNNQAVQDYLARKAPAAAGGTGTLLAALHCEEENK